MGAHPYWYVVPYDPDVNAALQRLREREFKAGQYSPVMSLPPFPLTPKAPAPGPTHKSIDQAVEDAGEDGTRSILDIARVGDDADFFTATRLSNDVLQRLYDTRQPTRAMVEANMDFFEDLERGHAIYVVLFRNGAPDELFFAGYSFD